MVDLLIMASKICYQIYHKKQGNCILALLKFNALSPPGIKAPIHLVTDIECMIGAWGWYQFAFIWV